MTEGGRGARLAAVRRLLVDRGLDAALVGEPHDVRYLSGFRGEDASLLVGMESAFICTDSRYWAQVAEEVAGFELVKTQRLPDDALTALRCKLGDGVALGFQGGHVAYAEWRRLRRLHDGGLRDLGDALQRLRMVKDADELATLARAAAVIDQALELAAAEGFVGFTEAEVAWRLEVLVHELGADGLSFDPIVAAGPRAALAHAIPGERRIERGELVLIDAGATVEGYCSDITRTFAVGQVDGRTRDLYETVLAAQLAGLAAVRPGVDGRDVDAAARRVIEEAGFGDAFGHGTGHGVGLQVHELPHVGRRRSDRLDVGMVHTVEPGIYLEGDLGVRIEDTVVVTGDGCERLTCSPKELRTVD